MPPDAVFFSVEFLAVLEESVSFFDEDLLALLDDDFLELIVCGSELRQGPILISRQAILRLLPPFL